MFRIFDLDIFLTVVLAGFTIYPVEAPESEVTVEHNPENRGHSDPEVFHSAENQEYSHPEVTHNQENGGYAGPKNKTKGNHRFTNSFRNKGYDSKLDRVCKQFLEHKFLPLAHLRDPTPAQLEISCANRTKWYLTQRKLCGRMYGMFTLVGKVLCRKYCNRLVKLNIIKLSKHPRCTTKTLNDGLRTDYCSCQSRIFLQQENFGNTYRVIVQKKDGQLVIVRDGIRFRPDKAAKTPTAKKRKRMFSGSNRKNKFRRSKTPDHKND